jgi:hypothetical protein
MEKINQDKQVGKTSHIAIASLSFGMLAIPIAFFTGSPLGIGPLVSGVYVVLVTLSIVLGVTALISITIFNQKKQRGIFLSVLGIVAALFSIFCFFIHFINTFNY